MNSAPCPGCGLPREADAIGVVPCPVCADDPVQQPGGLRPPLAEIPDPTRGLPADASQLPEAKPLPLRAVVVAVGLLAVVGWLAVRDLASGGGKSPGEVAQTSDVVSSKPTVQPEPAAPADSADPKPTGGLRPPLAVVVEPAVAPPPRFHVAVAPPPHFLRRPPDPRVTHVNHPNAEYTPQVKPGATVTLKGRAKTLRVPALEGGASLDTTELVVEEVIVFGRVDASKLRLGPSTRVTFQSKIDNRSTVEVAAPSGTVTFAVPTLPGKDGSKIDGGSQVKVTARYALFHGKILGRDTRVSVTVTRDGALGFAELDGPSRLEYRKADGGDPDPKLSRGKVGPAATVARVD